MRGDKHTDALYGGMRERYGRGQARANGYRYEAYFRREQAILFGLLDDAATVSVDVACGSGLMLRPLLSPTRRVLGVDFNAEACCAAAANGLPVVRGDAYHLPFADGAIEQLVNCQFFNQQTPAGVAAFVIETARVLAPGGRAVLVWRNGRALIHRVAHGLLSALDRWRGLPQFPQQTHPLETVAAALVAAGLVVTHRELSCPPLAWRTQAVDGCAAHVLGASCIVVATKPRPPTA